jgi:hypothetical protein
MDFVSVFRQTKRRIKNAGIAQEDIQTLSGRENLFRSTLD